MMDGILTKFKRVLAWLLLWALLAAMVHFLVLPVARLATTVPGLGPAKWAIIVIYVIQGYYAWVLTEPRK
jgi:hypothetical protein